MKKISIFIAAMALLVLSVSLYAQQDKLSIAGKWNVTVEGTAMGHTFPVVDLDIEQNGKKVTANFLIPEHGDLPMEGEFADGKLAMHATEDGYMQMDLKAEMKPDGTLAGHINGIMGDMPWTAKRAAIE
jgi:hypothetical protein